jgi:hypothetical protein
LDTPSSVCSPLGLRSALGHSTDVAGYRRQREEEDGCTRGNGRCIRPLFYQAPTDLYQRTVSAAAPIGLMTTTLVRTVALNVGDRRFVDVRIERAPRRVELIVTGSAKDAGVFLSG